MSYSGIKDNKNIKGLLQNNPNKKVEATVPKGIGCLDFLL